jgi:hypothetical protein
MKRFSSTQNSLRGTVSVIALIICAVGTLGLLGMVSIMQARVIQVNALDDECLRRVREFNGRQLAKDYAFRRIWTSSSGAAETVEIPNGWGRISVPAWNQVAFTTTQRSSVYNQTGPDPSGLPYQMAVNISVFNLRDTTGNWVTTTSKTVSTRIQSRALANTGVLLDARSQDATRTVSGNLRVYGKALVWQPSASNNNFSFSANQFSGYSETVSKSGVAVQNLAGSGALTPSNYPGLTFPNWFAAAVAAGSYPTIYEDDWGPFNSNLVISSFTQRTIALGAISLAGNATYNQSGITANGSGAFTINLNSLNLPSVVLTGPVTIAFTGQATAAEQIAVENMAPVIVVVSPSSTTSVTFSGNNSRPLILAFTSTDTATLPLSFPSGADYRLHVLADRQALSLTSPGTVTLRGGITTDDDLTVTAGTFDLRAETARPEWFDQPLWRSFWVETYQQL